MRPGVVTVFDTVRR